MVHIGDLSENMKVRARDGEELGTVIRVEDEGILVEKGISFLRDYLVPLALVSDVRFGEIQLSLTREELRARGAGSEGPAIAERTLRQETAEFVHEGGEGGAPRTPDNVGEGGPSRPPGG